MNMSRAPSSAPPWHPAADRAPSSPALTHRVSTPGASPRSGAPPSHLPPPLALPLQALDSIPCSPTFSPRPCTPTSATTYLLSWEPSPLPPPTLRKRLLTSPLEPTLTLHRRLLYLPRPPPLESPPTGTGRPPASSCPKAPPRFLFPHTGVFLLCLDQVRQPKQRQLPSPLLCLRSPRGRTSTGSPTKVTGKPPDSCAKDAFSFRYIAFLRDRCGLASAHRPRPPSSAPRSGSGSDLLRFEILSDRLQYPLPSRKTWGNSRYS